MSTPEFEVHRAIVHYSNPTTGEAHVRIPSLLGAGQTVTIPTTGLTSSDGFWNVPSIGSSTFIAVSADRTQFLWLTAIGVAGSGGDDPSNEPIGHEDRTASYIAFDNGTRTFSIQPANGSYVVWCVGLRYEKATLESIQIPDVTGLYYISFDAQGQLQYSDEFFVWDQDCPTAYVYWNSTTQRAEFLADERHGITMDWQTHEYLHRTRGAAYANGFDASNFDTSTQDGNTDAQAKLDIDNGTFFDEDLQVDVRHSLAPAQNTWEQQLQGPARIPVFYKIGTGWKYDAPTDFPVKQGTTHPVYNRTSDWSVQELGANSYGVQWIVATNQLNYPILSIMGQEQYSNVGQAESASWADMDLDGLPIVEIRVLYKIIFRATGSNTPGCYFEQIDDYRNALSNATSTAAAVVDHGNLTGLADDDHPQYAFRTTSPTITLAGDATGSVTLTDLGDGTLTVAVVNDSHTHDNRYYQRDGTYTTSDILTFQSNDNMRTSSGSQAALQVYQDTTNADAFMTFHVSGDYAVYFGLDGGINDLAVGGWSMGNTAYRIWHAGNDGSGSGLDADLLDGLHLHTGRNNEANKVVRTDGSGYIQAGWINTTSGATTSSIDRIYASNDGYIRYVTPATFRSQIINGQTISPDTLNATSVINTNYIRNTNGNFLALEGGDSWNLASNVSGEYVWLAAEGGIVIVSSDANSTVWANRNQVRISPTGGIDERLQIHARIYSAKTTGSEIADFYRTGSAPGNYTTLLVRNQYANHSWGIVGEFRIEGNSGTDKPAILFSSGQTSTTWAVGFNYTDDTFGIKQNRGHRNTSWGTDRLTITNAGIVRANTNSGYIEIGPVNTSYCHITTDRSQFYFNKKLVVDSGQISSYNENLTLQVNGSTVCVFEATDRMYLQTSTRGIQFANNDYLDYDDGINRFTFTDDGATTFYGDDGVVYAPTQLYSGNTLRVLTHATLSSGVADVGADLLSGSTYCFIGSKASIKENIEPMQDMSHVIDQLRPVTFIPRFMQEQQLDPFAPEDEQAKAWRLADLQYGFVADEVAELADGKLTTYEWNKDGTELEPMNWKHRDILAIVVKEVQSLRRRLEQLEVA